MILEQTDVKKQHDKGKYHALERIMLLVDKGSFKEIGSRIANMDIDSSENERKIKYDGVITGRGRINGESVFVFAQDYSQKGGSLGLMHGKKIAKIIELAIKARCPVIGIYDSGGARIEEGIHSLAGCGELMYQNVLASGYIPQISIIAGPCAGAAAYSPAITDFVYMVEPIGNMFLTGPQVVKKVTNEDCTPMDLGGANVHAKTSGVAHFLCESEKECFHSVRKLIQTLSTQENLQNQYTAKKVSYQGILPTKESAAYDIKEILERFVDADSFIEVHEHFACNMVVGFAKLSGKTIGIVANQPMENSGCVDGDASDKGGRFIRFCDAFDIPIVTFVDTPGFLPGIKQEHSGIIRHGAKLLFAYAEATTIKITIILRKAYGGAYIAMGSKHLNADYVYTWPMGQISVMGEEGAAAIIYKKEISSAPEEEKEKRLIQKSAEYREKYMNINTAVEYGYVDEMMEPGHMRKRVYDDIMAFQNKREIHIPKKKHGNIPM